MIVFVDGDASGTGQAVAWALAKSLITSGLDVEVQLPDWIGCDWADCIQANVYHLRLLGSSEAAGGH
jgi:hypothetical protein